MQYEVKGANRDTGKRVTITVEAASRADAQEQTNELGIFVSDVREKAMTEAELKDKVAATSELVFRVAVRVGLRLLFWIVFLAIAAYILFVFIPDIPDLQTYTPSQ